ncbi:(2Fe-2S) ferredoxin domain-containing protein [Pseudonocardia abyssalis]|uniref:(2Fe-2S) ferredoxin domain-containing protein n=1 Tax=Pseudonocardia abyssalis TaxID=2792008 RepID=A0ABS6UR61_9PSEU|nr:(2Fe-2S) ferredoxin domain-containing protein [Pseudonocardia abyssalis]MBW0117651.1 hypothetical protein [Pseudonocardia abyssalis]MBW0134672.1 hypothetical protein [Pseudonocardia abyssalis]
MPSTEFARSTELLLVARPTPAGVDARSLAALAAAVAERSALPVRVGHLDQAEPSIHSALDDAVAAGAERVRIVALAVPEDRYLTAWIGRAVAHWREDRVPDVNVTLATGLARHDDLAGLVARLGDDAGDPVRASPAGFRSPAWSTLPRVGRHLLVCRGPRCTAYDAGTTHRALTAATCDDPGTLVTPIGCLGPCNLGPLVIDNPAGTWHTGVDAAGVSALLSGPRQRS